MKLAPFTNYFARVVGLEPGTVHVFHQGLRAGGLITTGGRGFAGAEMLPSDATNSVLACLKQPAARQTAEVVQALRDLLLVEVHEGRDGLDGRIFEKVKLKDVPLAFEYATLGEALDGLFEGLMFDRSIGSDFQPGAVEEGGLSFSPPADDFRLWLSFSYGSDFTLRFGGKTVAPSTGIQTTRRISLATLKQISQLLSVPSPDATIALVPRPPAAAPPTKTSGKAKAAPPTKKKPRPKK
jgi:hypothetical protein